MYLTDLEKQTIANEIKPISYSDINKDFEELRKIVVNDKILTSQNKRIGLKCVNYFTFAERLETRGKYNMSFYDFVQQFSQFADKKYIQTMMKYYSERQTTEIKALYGTYRLCISAIEAMMPLHVMKFIKMFGCKRLFNPCAGWGGSLIAGSVCHLEAVFAFDLNENLRLPYRRLSEFLQQKSPTVLKTWITDASTANYAELGLENAYDMVFTSPPYYMLEKYPCMKTYASKNEMDEVFYKPMFQKAWDNMQIGGFFCINVCVEVYNRVLLPMLGEALYVMDLKLRQRCKNKELVFVWRKQMVSEGK